MSAVDSTAGEEMYTMQEVAQLKGVSYHTVSRAVRNGKLRAERLGRMALIAKHDLVGWRPMIERAPHKYRGRRQPDEGVHPSLSKVGPITAAGAVGTAQSAAVVAVLDNLGRRLGEIEGKLARDVAEVDALRGKLVALQRDVTGLQRVLADAKKALP